MGHIDLHTMLTSHTETCLANKKQHKWNNSTQQATSNMRVAPGAQTQRDETANITQKPYDARAPAALCERRGDYFTSYAQKHRRGQSSRCCGR